MKKSEVKKIQDKMKELSEQLAEYGQAFYKDTEHLSISDGVDIIAFHTQYTTDVHVIRASESDWQRDVFFHVFDAKPVRETDKPYFTKHWAETMNTLKDKVSQETINELYAVCDHILRWYDGEEENVLPNSVRW